MEEAGAGRGACFYRFSHDPLRRRRGPHLLASGRGPLRRGAGRSRLRTAARTRTRLPRRSVHAYASRADALAEPASARLRAEGRLPVPKPLRGHTLPIPHEGRRCPGSSGRRPRHQLPGRAVQDPRRHARHLRAARPTRPRPAVSTWPEARATCAKSSWGRDPTSSDARLLRGGSVRISYRTTLASR